ncbi:zinc-induced facilitator ZIF1 [Acrasis kona]|uniref:Zinc-induced facilitator ZIF1 n=1 Tax=Acrasis kona TaxID=1008807 RepID=A0AAW2ZA69_9EUKA
MISHEEVRDKQSSEDVSSSKPLVKTPLPKGEMIAMGFLFFTEGYNFTFIFSFIGYLVVDFGMAEDERSAGYYAGIVAASYSLCQFMSSFLYGYISDKYIILVGTAGALVAILFFGFSTNFWWALVSRSACGMLNANIATVKSYIGVITDETNQTLAFSIINITWGVGAIIGPALGGLLAQPATKYNIDSTFLRTFPYLLPCVCCAVVMLCGFVCGCFLLKDRKSEQIEDVVPETEIGLEEIITPNTDLPSSYPKTPTSSASANIPTDLGLVTHKTSFQLMLEGLRHNFLNKEFVTTVYCYFFVVGLDVMFEELFPLWSMLSTRNKGLGFQTNQIGMVQAMIGVLACILQLTYPFVADRIGHLNCLRFGSVFVLIMMATPQIAVAAKIGGDWLLWIVLFIYAGIRSMYQTWKSWSCYWCSAFVWLYFEDCFAVSCWASHCMGQRK